MTFLLIFLFFTFLNIRILKFLDQRYPIKKEFMESLIGKMVSDQNYD